eukprot:TRINITY_DN25540_c0_g1_i1.p2 TRINITY_DN25540_c0_g1~~TRINITY_DN25540_c0_g1_i1.p2  ORF type:complete len:131 (-),score=25.04 TRINITY_DN25540_c0_g1_i1:166-558(-)
MQAAQEYEWRNLQTQMDHSRQCWKATAPTHRRRSRPTVAQRLLLLNHDEATAKRRTIWHTAIRSEARSQCGESKKACVCAAAPQLGDGSDAGTTLGNGGGVHAARVGSAAVAPQLGRSNDDGAAGCLQAL